MGYLRTRTRTAPNAAAHPHLLRNAPRGPADPRQVCHVGAVLMVARNREDAVDEPILVLQRHLEVSAGRSGEAGGALA